MTRVVCWRPCRAGLPDEQARHIYAGSDSFVQNITQVPQFRFPGITFTFPLQIFIWNMLAFDGKR